MNSLFIHFLLHDFTINPVSILQNQYEFTSCREFTLIPLSFLHSHCEFIIFFADSLCILYLFGEFTIELRFFSGIHHRSIILSRFHYVYRKTIMNSLFVLRIHYDFTICVVNSLWFYCLFLLLNCTQRLLHVLP